MDLLRRKLESSPVLARIGPFLLFYALTICQGQFGEAGRYWIYFAKTVVGAWLVWETWPLVAEMRWRVSWEALVVGIGVTVMWVGLDPYYPKLNDLMASWGLSQARSATDQIPWNPFRLFGGSASLAWFFVLVRLAGSTLVVPHLEEVFYRSFLYRYLVRAQFLSVAFCEVHWVALGITSLIFASTHEQWLAGIFCGLAYQWLVIRKGRLGDALTAHAITNFLLGLWVVWKGAWNFW